tara:strand:- start:6761 stop:7735 length:975 start_codon:yes stop_codon:yes gene_type:complete
VLFISHLDILNRYFILFYYIYKMSMTNSEFNKNHEMLLNEKHQDLVKNIKELQEIEKYMFQNLERLQGNNESGEQDEIVNKINELSDMRIGLFNQLKGMYQENQGDLDASRRQLASEMSLVGVVESELNRLKENISSLESEKNNRIRMVEIGNYESDRYRAHISVMKTIVTSALLIFLSSVLLQNGFISPNISVSIILLVALYTIIKLAYTIYDMYRRNSFDYNKYDFPMDKEQLQPGYETVFEHDKKFFRKLTSDITGKIDKTEEEIKKMNEGLHKTAHNLTSDTSGLTANSMNKPNDVVNSQGNNKVTGNTDKFVENFAQYR